MGLLKYLASNSRTVKWSQFFVVILLPAWAYFKRITWHFLHFIIVSYPLNSRFKPATISVICFTPEAKNWILFIVERLSTRKSREPPHKGRTLLPLCRSSPPPPKNGCGGWWRLRFRSFFHLPEKFYYGRMRREWWEEWNPEEKKC